METTMQTWWALRKNLISRPYVPDGDVEPSQVQVVLYADAQATVEALQAQVKTARHDAVRAFVRGEDKMCLVCGAKEPCELKDDPFSPCTFDPTPMELKQQVEALQRERDHAQKMEAVQKEVADNQTWHVRDLRTALDAERDAAKVWKSRFDVLKQTTDVDTEMIRNLSDALTQLQALVRALPVVTGKLEVDCGACYYVRALDGKENPLVCGLIVEQATAFALKALFEFRATLDATTPAQKGGDGE